ncbi:MAG: TonB-dependent receptor, partial [Bacteroidales bacterium]|nr:TonB-dependent receptor [Bacteroidales bacterium]
MTASYQTAWADGNIRLKGWVKDAYNKSALADAHVIIEELQAGTITNKKGLFTFSRLAPGTYTLRITHIGYLEYHEVIVLDTAIEQTFLVRPRVIQIDPVTVTATLNKRKLSVMPARLAVIPPRLVEQLPANNTDDLLSGIANVYVHRPWGIFSKSASVTMRGLPGSSRTLILLDGVPMNKVSGGSVNWNFIEPSEIEDIEVVKGPSSAIYGNNAMTGVVNISTKKPRQPIEGHVSTFGGSLGTFGGSFTLGGNDLYRGSGIYWKVNGFTRKGDGYINEPEETRDSLDAKVDLTEYSAGFLAGYRFDTTTTLDISYRYYSGKFGTGIKVFEDDGSFDYYSSHLLISSFNGQLGKYEVNTRLYYQLENFTRQDENMNSKGKYKLSDTKIAKHDYGIWLNISRAFFRNHLFTAGLEAKMGDMDANDIYRTSTDDVRYGGRLAFAGLFIQDEFRIFRKLSAIAGLRFDYAVFNDGFLEVYNPTSNTGFIKDVSDNFESYSWHRFSPKLALQYQIHHNVGIYVSISTGFMPPKIDDLVKSGKISKGFKIANPGLKPESLTNYELGLTWMLNEKFSIEPSAYYSRGH